ncbi:MAG: hypothetical protein IJE77_04985 [Thermoguttaceae bacterium]|nr:hypothetical protein [Thermoguttaceae bacterium]MBQ7109894.1 hypothetical protein [Thermoguttaceae bacterium]
MFDSIWSRPSWEIFAFFAFGIALAATVCARAALRLGADYPLRRPVLFGAEVGAFLGLAICVFLWASTNPKFDEIDGAALNAWEKARLAGFPTTKALSLLNIGSCELAWAAAFVAQSSILGAIWGKFMLRRVIEYSERSQENVDARKDGESM